MKKWMNDTRGYAVIEATILFPIIIMIFAGLVLLATYLPHRVMLQRTAQLVATNLAVELSDTAISFDEAGAYQQQDDFPNVYANLISGAFGGSLNAASTKATEMGAALMEDAVFTAPGSITATCTTKNYVIYQEITITLKQTIPMPVDLSAVWFPTELELEEQAICVVQNGDEFIRNLDIARDITAWLDSKYGFTESLSQSPVFSSLSKLTSFLGF